jgi:NADH-quinone oxidoreductase subunit J
MTSELTIFSLLAVGAIASAILMITRRSPVVSVLYLIVHFFLLATLYLTLQAQFIAIIQILVYAGAIMVLFLFVIMLLNLSDEQRLREKITNKTIVAALFAAAMFAQIAIVFVVGTSDGPQALAPNAAEIGSVESIGKALFTKFLFPFEVTSILLLAAIVGVVVLAKKKFH